MATSEQNSISTLLASENVDVNRAAATNAMQTNNSEVAIKQSALLWSKLDKIFGWIGKILSSIGSVLKPLFRDLTPYIALILVILFIIGIARSASSPAIASQAATGINPPQLSWYNSWFTPGYQLRSLFSVFGTNQPTVNRPTEVNGRCDNVEWQHTGGDDTGLCVKTYKPETINWTLDSDKMPEIGKLPPKLAQRMNTSMRMQVYIPWEEQGTFYVPQCSRAYFKEMDDNGNEIHTPAGYLFNDKGLVCERVEKKSTEYGTAYRPKTTTNLYDFATDSNPKCNA